MERRVNSCLSIFFFNKNLKMAYIPKKIFIDKAFLAEEETNPGTASIPQTDRVDLDKYISRQIANGNIIIDGSGGENGSNAIEEVGTLKDTDLIMLARVNDQGSYAGFYVIKAGKLMRIIRGIPLDALTHLVAVGYKNPLTESSTINVPNSLTGALEVYDLLPDNLKTNQ